MNTETTISTGRNLFDGVQKQLLAGHIIQGMDFLVDELRNFYDAWPRESWTAFCQQECPQHSLQGILQQDPFTHHSFSKPRGYSGDAGLLDLIYQIGGVPQETTELGRKIYPYAINGAASLSVRARRELLGIEIDAVAARVKAPRVLSVACGHLREAELSRALGEGAIAELTAFDQDEQSLAEVERAYGKLNVQTVAGSVRAILSGKANFEGYDLVYAAGLYDYLSQPLARRLTAKLFAALNPGGKLLTANFLPTLRDIGYMEAFMDWHLLYRTEAEMADTGGEVPANQIASQRLFNDEPGNLVFLELVRA